MKYLVIVLLLTIAFNVNKSDGASGPTYPPMCKETKFRNQCSEKELPRGSCFIERWGGGPECEHLRLNETSSNISLKKNSQNLVEVKLGVYQYLHYFRSYPNPTISFSKINCTDVMVKLTVLDSNTSFCIKFLFSSSDHKLMETADFLYDCRWLPYQYKYMRPKDRVTIEYQASSNETATAEYKKFHFSLPENGTVDHEETRFHDFQLLVYREDVDDPPCATFHWSRPPEKFGVSMYRVTLHNMRDNVTKPDSVYIEDTKKSFCSLPEAGTSYFISVEPCRGSENNWSCGAISVSSPFYTNASNTHIIIVLLVALLILIIILLLLWCWYFIKLYASRRISKFKKCILVFEPSCPSHIIVLTRLVDFLETLLCHDDEVKVLFGERDIKNEDPIEWYSENLSDADLVLIVSNPKTNVSDVVAASTFFPVYVGGFVETSLRDIIKHPKKHRKKRFIKILLPYCNENNFYKGTKCKSCYHLLKEPHRLLQEIMGPCKWIPEFVAWLLFTPYFQTDEWADLVAAMKDFPNVPEATPPLRVEYEQECDQSCNTFSSTISEDEGAPNDVALRIQMLQMHEDEGSSGSESEFGLELEAVDVAIDDMAEEQLRQPLDLH